jgi:hypothetical protein
MQLLKQSVNVKIQIIKHGKVKVKVKFTLYRPPRAERGSGGIALLFLDLDARRGWVVSTTPRPLYPRERPGTHCTIKPGPTHKLKPTKSHEL